jgi:indole-3-glycerol phosphate synthase
MHLVREMSSIPILRKDFIFDIYQLYESRVWGADSFLLIASILDVEQMVDLFFTGTELGMHSLIEVHDEDDLEKALAVPCRLLGINNRDLKTFKTDTETTLELINYVPDDRVVISESGIKTSEDIEKLSAAGVRAFLIGELFMDQERPGDKLKELLGGEGTSSGGK